MGIREIIDFILHINKHLDGFFQEYGLWVYALLFLIVFCETGLVVTPFLPGDSLLFAAGALAQSQSGLNVWYLMGLLIVAAILGDTVNYRIGSQASRFFKPGSRFLKQEYLDQTHEFYEKYGPKTIVIARFVPIVRTFAPFVAGTAKMDYGTFLKYNIIGGILWVFSLTFAGYLLGSVAFVKENFGIVSICIIILSVLPIVYEVWKSKQKKRKSVQTAD